jgi:DNA-binding beta-propeller fold protein YncE
MIGQSGPGKLFKFATLVVCAIGAGWLAGCSGGGGGSSAIATRSDIPATNSSIFAVDCKRQRAFVPLPNLNVLLHGQVAVLDLSVDPDETNPLLEIIDIGITALPRAAAVDPKSGTVLVLADNVNDTGILLLINEANDALSTFSFPAGSRPSETSGIVFDPKNNTALVSMTDASVDCTTGAGSCTGQAVFDLASETFGPLILTTNPIDSFGLDSSTDISIGSSDLISPQLFAFDVPNRLACFLDDQNVETLDSDPDAMAVDPTTGIWIAGNFESPVASVINLNGSEFSGSVSLTCALNEGGTPPNSVNHDTGTGASGMPGVAINPATHQALMTAEASDEIALLSLPSRPVKQIAAAQVTSVNSTIPDDPTGNLFEAAEFPYGTVADSCHNLGYVINTERTFLAQIDLKLFNRNAAAIGTALPAGTCAGVVTQFQCDNENGVKFYPL